MTNEEYKKQFERLELDDQNSKGCSITLAEWLNNRNVNIIYDFITQALDEVREEAYRGGRVFEAANCKDSIIDCHEELYEEAEEYLAKKQGKDTKNV